MSVVARLSALSLLVQTVELLALREAFTEQGVFPGSLLAEELEQLPRPLRWLSLRVFAAHPFTGLLWLQLALALGMLVVGPWPLAVPALASALLVCMRLGGNYNGGSDSMTLLTLAALALSVCVPARAMQSACVLYIAVQSCLSYFLAGVVKLKEPSWRSGLALGRFAALSRYAVPPWAQRLLQHRLVGPAASWLVMTFELSFALALTHPSVCAAYLALGLCFHAGNAALFGLNRFLWAWSATYPALWYVATR